MTAIPDNMSDLYADIRTSCGASRVCSRAASLRNDDGGSVRSGRQSCLNCGHEVEASHNCGRRFRPLKWLGRLVLLSAAAAAAGRTEWGRSVIDRQRCSVNLGQEFDTGAAVVGNGVEAFTSREALTVWVPEVEASGRMQKRIPLLHL